MKASIIVFAAAALLNGAHAFFRMPCAGPLILERSDPIVNPGAVSTHLHNVVGANAFNFTMNYKDAVSATCSTCKAKADKSNYWIPNLFVKAKNGSFHNVNNGGATIYYLQRRGSPDEELIPFPEGFRMVAGNPMIRSLATGAQKNGASFACLGTNKPETRYIPNYKCPYGLRAQMVMPSCWDGVNLDSPDHKSHVAYPSLIDNGKCPPTHPKRFITLFYEFLFDIASWDSEWNGDRHPFVLSNGDRTGYSFHADFLNGWETPILKRAIKECNAASGAIEECKVLDLFTDKEMNDCIVPPSVKEKTTGWLDRLPGCNPIQPGPKNAVQQINCGATTVIGPKTTYSTDVSAKGWKYIGCANDDLGDRTLPVRYAKNDMTVEKCIDYCVSKGYTYAGLEYTEECFCGNSVAQSRLGAQKCTMPCGGDSSQYCGGPLKLSLYQKNKPVKRPRAAAAAPASGRLNSRRMR
ncbi:hypothetical protein BZA77DRAFT_359753 [Pyronema omphalodes]|nr:hypothetical protein BZA77DRAFT_359753 [Pyronema omphalodes]